MNAMIEQLKCGHEELKRIWKQALTESGNGSGPEPEPATGPGIDMEMAPETQAGLMRAISGLKQNLYAIGKLGHRQIEAVAWSGIAVIEKDIEEKKAFRIFVSSFSHSIRKHRARAKPTISRRESSFSDGCLKTRTYPKCQHSRRSAMN